MDKLVLHAHQFKTVSSFTVLLALLVWESLAPFFPYFIGRLAERSCHALRNFALGLFNALLTGLFSAGLWAGAAVWADANHFGLLHWLRLPGFAQAAAAILLFDCWMYWWHRWNHEVPFFWRFHRTHHSDPRMDVTTSHRFHFGEIIFSSLLRVPVIAMLGMRLEYLVIYETLQFAVVELHHANVGLPARLDRWLRLLIVTPAIHKVHHSRLQAETDSNYSSLLSVWDRLFGSFRLRADPHTIEFGLAGFDQPEKHTLLGLMKTPLN